MCRRNDWSHDRCPRCDQPNEDIVNVLACRKPSVGTHYQQSVTTAITTLDSIGTSPDIVLVLKSRLLSWGCPSARNLDYYPMSSAIRSALRDQASLSWYQALTGRLSLLWQDAQVEWRYKCLPIRWAGQASLAHLEISWQMWEHRNHIYHDPAHPWSVQRSQDISQQIINTLGAHNDTEILKRDCHLFSISPQVLTQRFYDAEKYKWMASVTYGCLLFILSLSSSCQPEGPSTVLPHPLVVSHQPHLTLFFCISSSSRTFVHVFIFILFFFSTFCARCLRDSSP
jgi:hypothetical protein